MRKNRLKLFALLILVLFVLYNIVWTIYVRETYGRFNKALGYGSMSLHASQDQDGYTYEVKSPTWPTFTGNLYITQDMSMDENGLKEDAVDILIWPTRKRTFEIVIMVEQNQWDEEEQATCIEEKGLLLDENMNLITKDDLEAQQLYEEHINDIRNLYKLAYDKWGILNYEVDAW